MMQPAQIYSQRDRKRAFSPTPADERILELFPTYHRLLARQIAQLLYEKRDGSRYDPAIYANERLKVLATNGYVEALTIPKIKRAGSTPLLYQLTRSGTRYATSELGADACLPLPSHEGPHSYRYFEHTLLLNDYLIQLELFRRAYPALQIPRLVHERLFTARPLMVSVPILDQHGAIVEHHTKKLRPDSWFELRFPGNRQLCCAIELDTGTEQRVKWQTKVASLVSWAESGSYEEWAGTSSLRYVVLVSPGESVKLRHHLTTPTLQREWAAQHVQELLSWTVQELERRDLASYADFFRFGVFLPQQDSPADLFLGERLIDGTGNATAFLHHALLIHPATRRDSWEVYRSAL